MDKNRTKNRSTTCWLVFGVTMLVLVCCVAVITAGLMFYPQLRSQFSFVEGVISTPAAVVTNILPVATQTQVIPGTMRVVIETPAQLPPTTEPTPRVSYRGISFSFDSLVAQNALPEDVAAAPGDPTNAFPGDIHPAYVQFGLQDYPLKGTFHQPVILIYPAQEYGTMDPKVAQIISNLQSLLNQKPATIDRIPFLPLWPAEQFMRAQIKYLEFKNGAGVRFLTQYGQAYWPINNTDMFYTFQGLSSNGQWYIAAILPVSHPSLPANGENFPGGDMDAFANNFPIYIKDIEAQLSNQPADSFLPSLQLLDAMTSSLYIE